MNPSNVVVRVHCQKYDFCVCFCLDHLKMNEVLPSILSHKTKDFYGNLLKKSYYLISTKQVSHDPWRFFVLKTCDGWVCGVDIFTSRTYSDDHEKPNVDIAQNGKQSEQHAVNTTHKTLNSKGFSSKTENCKEKKSLNRKGVVVRETNAFHKAWGHPSESITHATAKTEGIMLTGKFKTCEDCALGKARQMNVSKKVVTRSSVVGERLFWMSVHLQQRVCVAGTIAY